MRTLRRRRHVVPLDPDPTQEQHVRSMEERRAEQRRRWWALWRRTAVILVPLGLVYAGAKLWSGWQRVADGIVSTPLEQHTASARILVERVYVDHGQRVRRGDPLLRLNPLGADGRRATLAHRVEQRKAELQLARHGESVDSGGTLSGRDRLEQARLALLEAEAALHGAELRRETLADERAMLGLELRQEQMRVAGRLDTLAHELQGIEFEIAEVGAEAHLVEFETESGAKLWDAGLISERDLVAVTSRSEIQRRRLQYLGTRSDAIQETRDSLRASFEFEEQRITFELEALDRRLERATVAAEDAQRRVEHWREVEAARRKLYGEVDAEELRALRVTAADARLRAAQAELAAYDEALGGPVVVATMDGVVDLGEVDPGAVLEEGALLCVVREPRATSVRAWILPRHAREIEVGAECTIVPRDGSAKVPARVQRVARAHVTPPFATFDADDPDARRVAVRVVPVHRGDDLSADARVKVVFR